MSLSQATQQMPSTSPLSQMQDYNPQRTQAGCPFLVSLLPFSSVSLLSSVILLVTQSRMSFPFRSSNKPSKEQQSLRFQVIPFAARTPF
uniref:Uncharacterized protein n=1 Tax=Rhizophora mucronata TaxID=61149 RepID=A0A2P2JGP8_RHIMU